MLQFSKGVDMINRGFVPPAPASPRDASPSGLGRATFGALFGIAVLALAIRFGTLSEQSFWLDEAYTVHLVRLPFGAMLREIPRSESTPPLYYVVAWTWTHVFGSGELPLRSLSALAGTATVFVSSLIAGRLAGRRAAVVAGALVAMSPLMVWFSQEARAYALASLLAALSVFCVIAYADTDRVAWLRGWAACAALGVLTHYFVVFVVLPAVIWLSWSQRGRRAVRIAVAVVVAVMIALIPLALAQRGTGHADYIAHGDLVTRILQVPKQFLIGYASPGQLITTSAAVALLIIGVGGSVLRGRVRLHTSTRLVLAAGVSGAVVPMILALLGADFLDTRNVLPALAPLTAVIAVGFAGADGPTEPGARPMSSIRASPPWRLLLGGALAAVGAIVVLLVDTHAAYQRTDWRGASQALGTAAGRRAIVVSREMPSFLCRLIGRACSPSVNLRRLPKSMWSTSKRRGPAAARQGRLSSRFRSHPDSGSQPRARRPPSKCFATVRPAQRRSAWVGSVPSRWGRAARSWWRSRSTAKDGARPLPVEPSGLSKRDRDRAARDRAAVGVAPLQTDGA